jgi:hypothetical protein
MLSLALTVGLNLASAQDQVFPVEPLEAPPRAQVNANPEEIGRGHQRR